MEKKKIIFMITLLCFVLSLGFNVNTKTAQALTQKQVKAKISTLNKEIKKLNTKKKKVLANEKKQKKGTIAVTGTLISRNPYIVCSTSLIGNVTSYYWITDSKNMTTLLNSSFGFIKLTGKHKTYNGYTCAVGRAVKVSNQSISIQKKIDKKEKSLKKYTYMLNDRVVFYKDGLNNDSTYVIQKGMTGRLPWNWNSAAVGFAYNYKKYNGVKWKSSNSDIVSVNSKGEVTARKEGKATIFATCALSKKTTKCPVVVTGQSDESTDNENNNNNDYSSVDYIDFVKQSIGMGYEDSYGNQITYGDAFSYFFTKPTWDYFRSDDGADVVEFTGGCLDEGEDIIVCMQFIVNVKNRSWQIEWLDFNGEEQSRATLNNLLDTVFSAYDA